MNPRTHIPAPAQSPPAPADDKNAQAAASLSISSGEPPAEVTPEEGMRYYAAILGREPTLDPEAPDLLPGMSRDGDGPRHWTDDLAILRDDISRKLHATLKRRPNWREIMDAMTIAASRRIEEARKRLQKRDAA